MAKEKNMKFSLITSTFQKHELDYSAIYFALIPRQISKKSRYINKIKT